MKRMTLLTPGRPPFVQPLAAWLPHGSTLPSAQWQVRHRAVTWLLLFHAAVFGVASSVVDASRPPTC